MTNPVQPILPLWIRELFQNYLNQQQNLKKSAEVAIIGLRSLPDAPHLYDFLAKIGELKDADKDNVENQKVIEQLENYSDNSIDYLFIAVLPRVLAYFGVNEEEFQTEDRRLLVRPPNTAP